MLSAPRVRGAQLENRPLRGLREPRPVLLAIVLKMLALISLHLGRAAPNFNIDLCEVFASVA
eukprot:1156105-Heterocapsa_arctica.AAC.1